MSTSSRLPSVSSHEGDHHHHHHHDHHDHHDHHHDDHRHHDHRHHDAGRGRIVRAILWYQRAVEGRPSPCRFFPSCSSYALEAVETHGNWRGGRLAVRRLLRCRPFGPSGFDPVPAPDPLREEVR